MASNVIVSNFLLVAARSMARRSSHSARRFACRSAATDVAAAVPLHRLSLVVTSPTATRLLAGYFASELHEADCYLLYGSVGSGKSYFCREFIRAACEDEDLPVPSPTFLLQNIYERPAGPPVHHFDLYRLTAPHDLLRLDLPASLCSAVSLIEWAERLGVHALPGDHLAIHLQVLLAEEEEELRQRGLAPPELSEMEDDSDAEESGDLRWRRLVFSSSTARWQRRMESLRQVLEARGAEYGCWLDQ